MLRYLAYVRSIFSSIVCTYADNSILIRTLLGAAELMMRECSRQQFNVHISKNILDIIIALQQIGDTNDNLA